MARRRREEEEENLIEKVIYINRVAKVVKGGRRFSFSAIVVVGNGNGSVGVGFGKANEVPEAIRKGTEKARRSMKAIPLVYGTIPHDVEGRFGSGHVVLRPAAAGTGVIAGPAVRAIMEAVGIHNVLTKSLRSTNPHNVVRATFGALDLLESAEQYAQRTGKDIEQVYANYTVRPAPVAGPAA
ncbi:MAG: 30S ribosomal protein S5 [Alphaproteobacteria bacterium]|nr:30S ribosomal protein S5 [Alphaproteobacteria bacterium]MCB9696135.1 30S ribosomal protein S5 [Alphaproteobacteria bacterium]